MASITRVIALSEGSYSTTSTTYAGSGSHTKWLYTEANYDGTITAIFEIAALKSDTAGQTAYATLWDITAGAAVSGGEVSRTSSSYGYVRSGEVTLVTGHEYTVRIKSNNASYTATGVGAKIVLVQTDISTKTEATIDLVSSSTTSSTSYTDAFTAEFTYNAAEWGGTKAFYLEVLMYTSNASYTAYACLTDDANNQVSGSELTTTSVTTSPINRYRTSSISLVDGTTYKVRIKNSSASGTTTLKKARLIVVQTVAALPTISAIPMETYVGASTSTTGTRQYGDWTFAAADWSGLSLSPVLIGSLKIANAAATASVSLYNKTDATHEWINSTTSTAPVAVSGATSSLVDNKVYDCYVKTSNATYAATSYAAVLLVKASVSSSRRRISLIS